MAEQLNPTCEITKNNVGAGEIIDISIALDLHELIKISVSSDVTTDTKTILNAICALTGAEPVSANDNEIVIYRHSASNAVKHIEF